MAYTDTAVTSPVDGGDEGPRDLPLSAYCSITLQLLQAYVNQPKCFYVAEVLTTSIRMNRLLNNWIGKDVTGTIHWTSICGLIIVFG
jgi:hypothetical protein